MISDKELLKWIKKEIKHYHCDVYGDDESKKLSNRQIKNTLKVLLGLQ